ncbi:MAG: hypothetical protein HFH68_10660 [Lachnospiraceae bacterium]|nr:hypothetical protein [Lachnospiraceae bacterium]
MKITDKKKPVQTIPEGVWESSRPRPYKDNKEEQERPVNKTTDLQGNGYPVKKTI